MNTKEIHISDYNYPLSEERIAKFPLPQRDSSKLLVYRDGDIEEHVFREISDLLPGGALMVFNNTRVIQARLHFRKGEKGDGALIEIFLLEPAFPVEYQENFASKGKCNWYCLVGNSKKWKGGQLFHELEIEGKPVLLSAFRLGTHGTSQEIMFEWDGDVAWSEILEAMGELPISWPVIFGGGRENSPSELYGITGIPTMVGINPDGTIAAISHGTADILAAFGLE